MTAVAEELSPSQAIPGWGIKAELMPPEVLGARQAKVVRRLVVLTLSGLLIACLGAYVLVVMQGNSATSALKKEQTRTAQLQARANSFSNVVQLKAAIASVQGQIAGLMTSDAKIESVLTQVAQAAPAGTAFSQITVAINTAAPSGTSTSTSTSTSGGTALNADPVTQIGTVTLAATTPKLTDLAAFLDGLSKIKGVIQPYPGPATVSSTGVQISVQFSLSNALLTHNFDVKTGTK